MEWYMAEVSYPEDFIADFWIISQRIRADEKMSVRSSSPNYFSFSVIIINV